jgi:hypothetical protein
MTQRAIKPSDWRSISSHKIPITVPTQTLPHAHTVLFVSAGLKRIIPPYYNCPSRVTPFPGYCLPAIYINERTAAGTFQNSEKFIVQKKEDTMTMGTEVFYETDNGIFKFTVDDVMDHLNRNEPGYDEKVVTVLKDLLSSAAGDSITIPKDLRLFPYIALNLIRDSKGTVFCNTCENAYEAAQLKPVTVGHGETPLLVNVKGKGWLMRVFGKKEMLPLFGGRGYACPQGDELIALVTWRT